MKMKNRKSSPILILITLILFIGIVFSLTNRTSHSSSLSEASDHIAIDDIVIKLSSPTTTHYNLQESEFILSITSEQKVELIEPIITLEMLHMDCGIVSARLSAAAGDETAYSVNAAPLMKGVWVATASFQLEDQPDHILQLHYTFEVL